MKKKIIIILLAILIGSSLSILTLSKIKKEKEKEIDIISLTVLQTGVFKNYENALKEKEKYIGSIVYEKDDSYYVIVGASLKEEGLVKIENILKNQNIHYYKKELEILDSDKELFLKYNMLLEKAENEETVLLLNKKILEKMGNYEL